MNRIAHIITTSILTTSIYAQSSPDATPIYEIHSGYMTANDGSFNYQGYLEVDGEPANGMYSFRFEAFNDPTGSDIASELFFVSPTIPVVDGLFMINVQMGGTPGAARSFWRSIGDQEMYFEIGVSEFEGGPYTTLGTRAPLGWSARAQYAGISESLRFPYVDNYIDTDGDPVTLITLSSTYGGTLIRLQEGENSNDPILDIQGETAFGIDFGPQNGAVRVDAMNEPVGILATGNDYALVGLLPSSLFADSAILGQVQNGTAANALTALNQEANTYAILGTPSHAGNFGGDVVIDGNLEVDGEPVRDFGSNTLSPIGPIAYASVSSGAAIYSGTSNIASVVWNPTGWYEIEITGESVTFQTHIVSVNVIDSFQPRMTTTNFTGSGKLLVYIWDLDGFAIQDNFHVVVYKADPNAFLRNPPPPGVDPESYYEQTGIRPVVGTTSTRQPAPVATPKGIGN